MYDYRLTDAENAALDKACRSIVSYCTEHILPQLHQGEEITVPIRGCAYGKLNISHVARYWCTTGYKHMYYHLPDNRTRESSREVHVYITEGSTDFPVDEGGRTDIRTALVLQWQDIKRDILSELAKRKNTVASILSFNI